jgi:hypothetical protein
MKKDCIIAVCDILGFTELVRRNAIDRVVDSSFGWFRRALYHSLHKGEFPQDAPTLEQLQDHSNLGLALFSDTILLYTLEDTDECFRALTSSIAWLLFITMFTTDCRLRCGISYGEAYIDSKNSVFIGKPIIDAHDLERSQAWSGGALSLNAVQRVPEEARSGVFADWFLRQYKVPLQENKSLDTLAINWAMGWHPPWVEMSWSEKHKDPPPEEWEKRPRLCEKWKNTKRFHDEVCLLCSPRSI